MDRFAMMQAFSTVAEAGTFTGAAQRLRVSKSVLSKQVSALEDHLGARLLNRTTRRLHLTEVGMRYYEHCQRLLGEIDDMERAVHDLQARPRGTLRVNVPVSFGHLHLAPIMPALLARYPTLSLDITLNDRFVDLVNEGYDAAVRIGRLDDSSLIARHIADCESWLCASQEYLARHGTPSVPDDLREHNCLAYAYAPQAGEWRLTDRTGHCHRVRVQGNLRANNGEFLLEAAIQGTGLVLMPDFIAHRAVADGRLQRLFGDYRTQRLGLSVVYPYTRHVSAKLRAFVDCLIAGFAANGTTAWH